MNETPSEAQTFDKARRELVSAGRNLWLAGLGAVAEVEAGGRGLFDRLVERGRPLEKRQRKALKTVGGKTGETVRELSKLVQDTMEYETKGVLKKLGMLTREDLKVLTARLDTLSRKIDEIAARQEIDDEEATEEPAAASKATTATRAAAKERKTRQRKS
jgi:poly(hydroxyalkanoate) granule-associated protein